MTAFNLTDRVIVITGGAGGLGTAMAKTFLDLGAKVALTDVGDAGGEEEAEKLGENAAFFPLDVTDSANIERAADEIAERFGNVTGVCANAGIAPTSPALEYDDDLWRKVIDINQTGVFLTARVFADRIVKAEKPGSIVLTSSIAGLSVVHPERHVAYGASKAAVAHMAALLGVEWAKKHIRVNAIAPGYIDTSILDKMREENPETVEEWKNAMPIGRLLEAREVANVAAFLLSDMASSITGETLACDGGYSKA
ncbi:SDR family NAD(P)-dependent oxidoreductase [Aurantiacibacter sediminis]|uniref:SDR family oxidoreductase n=1 Tax=Aurantiacibacter sediminis TaxID=2793064 RepID=A0ABS0N1G7_9SPHN|nr:SDR family oxidoreductase [Aurantiacibacter sediminis]MBH5321818.1 SDR family oxidoreductase [Aurantiacibacter sediminis]